MEYLVQRGEFADVPIDAIEATFLEHYRGTSVAESGDFDSEADDASEIQLEILDGEGEVLRKMSSVTPEYQAPNPWRKLYPELFEPPKLTARPGANRWVWNLRLGDAHLVDTAVLWGSARGPRVPPGTYGARLTVGDWSDTVSFDVVPDPRDNHSLESQQARFALAKEIWQSLTESHDGIRRIRGVRTQITALAGLHENQELADAVAALDAKITGIENRLNQTKAKSSQDDCNYPPQLDNQLVYLLGMVESAPGAPPVATRERYSELKTELDAILGELEMLLAEELPKLESILDKAEAPRILSKG
jgi:hypothetical protein